LASRINESDLRLIIDSIPASAWSARPDGSIDFFNEHYLDYVGLAKDQADFWDFNAAIHPEDLNTLTHALQAILASGQPGETEARLRRFDGEYRWFLIRANPFRDRLGTIVKWYGVNTDIDERKRAEERIRRTQAEIAHMARVMTMGALTASIAHEINQPLSGIITNASACLRMLANNPPNVDGARETARRTIRDGNRAADVITRLRALFIKRPVAIEPVDLNDAVREVIALCSGELKKARVILETELPEKLPLVSADRIQLQQVIINLIRNASDAMLTVEDRPRKMVIRTEHSRNDQVRLSVCDCGIGFDLDNPERLFEAFYTTKSDGMGIGLSVSRSIIASHQGRLWAARNEGPGATFSFSIPRDRGELSLAGAGPDAGENAVRPLE
jgi:PAS domain S-box-containing protein